MSVIESAAGNAEIDPKRLYELYESGEPIELVDVRTPAEYRSLHATIARLLPLDELDPKTFMETRRGAKDAPIYVICRSEQGARRRVRSSSRQGSRMSSTSPAALWPGSRRACRWYAARAMLPLDRQVQIMAGTMVLAGFALGEIVNANWFLLSGFRRLRSDLRGCHRILPVGIDHREDALESGRTGRDTVIDRHRDACESGLSLGAGIADFTDPSCARSSCVG